MNIICLYSFFLNLHTHSWCRVKQNIIEGELRTGYNSDKIDSKKKNGSINLAGFLKNISINI